MVIEMSNKDNNNLQKKQNNQLLIQHQQTVSSPLPPPEWLEGFVKVYPNAAKEIFEDFKKVSETNRKISLKVVNNETEKIKLQSEELKIIKLLQWQGFFATILILFLATFCAYIDQKEVALGFLGISFIGIIQALIRKK